MRRGSGRWAALAMLFLAPTVAWAAPSCDAVLANSLISKLGQGAAADAATQRYLSCAFSFEDHRRTYGDLAAFAFELSGGKGPYDQASYDQLQASQCAGLSAKQASSAAAYRVQQSADVEAIKAWRDCKFGQPGLSCVAQPMAGGEDVLVQLIWRSDRDALAKVTSSSLRGGRVLTERTPPGQLLQKGALLGRGMRTLRLARNGEAAVSGALNVSAEGAVRTCTLFVPSLADQRRAPVEPAIVQAALSRPGLSGFGGIAYSKGDCAAPNPATGGCDRCAAGFKLQVLSVQDGPGFGGDLRVCYRADATDFGGMAFAVERTCPAPNPLASRQEPCACPAGFALQEITGAGRSFGFPGALRVCNGIAGGDFGGMFYIYGDQCLARNPFTAACACPDGGYEPQWLSLASRTGGNGGALVACYRPGRSVASRSMLPRVLDPTAPPADCTGSGCAPR